MIRGAVRIAACCLLWTAGYAAAQDASYGACMALARSDPMAGFDRAVAWEGLGGGDAARHCAAVALNTLGEHGEAARRLEALTQNLRAETAVRVDLLAQAAQAWILAGDTGRAEAVLGAAIALRPDDPRLYVDRAGATAAAGRYGDAAADLDRALGLDPDSADALALRAAARRRLGDQASALLDAEEAVQIDPEHTGALLERGVLRQAAGDEEGARRDWLTVLDLAPTDPVAELARARIEAMDVQAR